MPVQPGRGDARQEYIEDAIINLTLITDLSPVVIQVGHREICNGLSPVVWLGLHSCLQSRPAGRDPLISKINNASSSGAQELLELMSSLLVLFLFL